MANAQDEPGGTAAAALGRRELLKGATLIAAAAAAASPAAATAPASPRPLHGADDRVVARAGAAAVEIEPGKVAGYVRNGIFTFKGMPYGDTTEGANRFLPPKKPKSWSGVRSSRQFGFICPQDRGTGRQNDEEAFIFQWNDSFEGEDCLRVNVWTPDIHDGRRRPVMVWLHGGGFEAGSGNDLPAFDGENLARRGDVVVVTLNHRLNLLGFLDLSGYGERYAQSGNVGMLDIVAALQWVRDNIAAFGGDPQRVLIFGQSGGGAKVGALMGMPLAKGLFHRAVVESGSFAFTNTPDKSRRLADLILAELGIAAGGLETLHTLPYAQLQRASVAALAKANGAAGGAPDLRKMATRLMFAPVADGQVLPEPPFSPKAPAISSGVPMIIGTTLNEFTTGMNHPEYELMTEGELAARAEAAYPTRGAAIVAAFRQRTPDVSPFDLWSRIATAPVRQAAIDQAAAKAALGGARAYLYWFTWQTPIFDRRPRAFHCAEIPFVFHNTDLCDHMTGGGPRARGLNDVMADTWIQFARTGDPNHPGLPQWAPFARGAAPTMIFDDHTRLGLDPDGGERSSISAGRSG
ncbi:MAG TPA: carboxylesterase family protein [Caulobacteraceae bacterium]